MIEAGDRRFQRRQAAVDGTEATSDPRRHQHTMFDHRSLRHNPQDLPIRHMFANLGPGRKRPKPVQRQRISRRAALQERSCLARQRALQPIVDMAQQPRAQGGHQGSAGIDHRLADLQARCFLVYLYGRRRPGQPDHLADEPLRANQHHVVQSRARQSHGAHHRPGNAYQTARLRSRCRRTQNLW